MNGDAWTTVAWVPPDTIAVRERKPWWKFWRKARVTLIETGAHAGYFVAVGNTGRVMVSPDAVNWTQRSG